MRGSITKSTVNKLKPGELIADNELRGFIVRRLPSGALTYGLRYSKNGRRRWLTIGVGIAPAAARKAALKLAGDVAGDGDPLPDRQARRLEALTARTVDQVLDDWLREYVKVKQLRSYDEMESLLRRHVRPALGSARINSLKRSEVAKLLSDIAALPSTRSSDGLSRRVADKVLGVLRSAFHWHQARDDDFVSPIVTRMSRTTLRELTRNRILDDAEIRTLWRALDKCEPPAYARLLRALLLSAARLNELAKLQWTEISGDVAVVPGERVKTKLDHAVPITPALAAVIGKKPAETAGDFVFSTDHGETSFSSFSKAKKRADNEIAKLRTEAGLPPMPAWRVHDLRRTGRSLLSRAQVDKDIAERVLGHALPGIRRTYDVYSYVAEKRDALDRLAALVKEILEPPPTNVVSLRKEAAR